MMIEDVAGLAVRRWGEVRPDEPVVLALHGLTSTSAVWADLADRLDGLPVVAPDLPGRGGSMDAPAGPGLRGLAAEVARVVDALGLRRVVVVGHSMGAFLVPAVVARLGDRTLAAVLVDGGVPPEKSLLLRPLVVRAVFSLQMRRVVRRWSDVDAYTATADGGAGANRPDLHLAFRAWSEAVLRPEGAGWRPRLDPTRIVADGVDSLAGDRHLDALEPTVAPVHLIAAGRGADDRKPAFLSDRAIADGQRVVPRLTWQRVDANHATMLFDPAVAAAVTAAARPTGPSGGGGSTR